MPPQKELNALYYDDLADRLGEYEAHFSDGEEALVRCDFSVRYMAEPNALEAVRTLAPRARIIAILRDPVEQVQSHYWHLRRQNFAQAEPVSPAPSLFDALERFHRWLVEPALYGKHLASWFAALPAEQFFIVDYAELKSDPLGVLDRLWDFLGLRQPPKDVIFSDDAAPSTSGRRGVSPRGGPLSRIYPALYTAVARGPYQTLKQLVGVKRADALKRRLRLRETAEAVFFKPGYEKLDADGQKLLAGLFEEDRRRLEALGVVDTSGWVRA